MQLPLSSHDAKQYRPLALAFLGDSVFDTLVRTRLLLDANRSPAALHSEKTKLVCADVQAAAVKQLQPLFTEEEDGIFRRARNAVTDHVPKHSSAAAYRAATGLEAVFGFLYLTGQQERMDTFIEFLFPPAKAQS